MESTGAFTAFILMTEESLCAWRAEQPAHFAQLLPPLPFIAKKWSDRVCVFCLYTCVFCCCCCW